MKQVILSIFIILQVPIFAQLNWKANIDSCNFFSSPNTCDLNSDGILDIVIGGGIEYQKTNTGVLAFNGKNGDLLWRIPARSQIYTSALFQDINLDGTPEVFIGGRDALYFCIDGKSGQKIWEFWNDSLTNPYSKGWYNFYGCTFTHDFDKDGYKDLLVTNGGDHLASANKKTRPTANLMILSAKTGKILLKQALSENKESYYAPHTLTFKGKEYLIYGSGGETIGGSLRTIPYLQFLTKGLSKSAVISADSSKGYILNTIVAQLNADKIPDLVSINMNGEIKAITLSGQNLWKHQFEGYENYVTPSFGFFNADKIPDVFTIFALGQFPAYSSFKTVIFDGQTGAILYEAEEGFNQFSPAVSADLNGDKCDEFIFIENQFDFESKSITWRIKMIDSKTRKSSYLSEPVAGCSMASSPLITDLNKDGIFELVLALTTIDMINEQNPKSMIHIVELPQVYSVSWDKYLGPKSNGNFIKTE